MLDRKKSLSFFFTQMLIFLKKKKKNDLKKLSGKSNMYVAGNTE